MPTPRNTDNRDTPLPDRACDCHVHLFGPAADYPFAAGRVYTPGDAGETELLALHRRLGIDRVVLVQASPYGADNSRLLAGLAQLGPRARAVAVIDPDAAPAELEGLHAAGVRGVRVNIATGGQHDPEIAWRLIAREADRAAPLGWHVQVLTKLSVIKAIAARIPTLPVTLVIDHFGHADMTKPLDQPGFQELLQLVAASAVWVKLSAIERLCGPGQLHRVRPFIDALVAANPGALVWGSDWPHTGGGRGDRSTSEIEPFMAMDDADALASLRNAVADASIVKRILVDNPARLYGFDGHSA